MLVSRQENFKEKLREITAEIDGTAATYLHSSIIA